MGVYSFQSPSGSVYKIYNDMLQQTHLLIGGTTGSGKSVTLNSLIATALYHAPSEYSFAFIDLKRTELTQYKNIPHTFKLATESVDAVVLLREMVALMETRWLYMEENTLKEYDGTHIIICIDEFADLIDENKDVFRLMKKLLRLGRAARIHCWVATQSPSRKVIPADVTLNFTAQLALRCRTAIESRQVIGISGAEKLSEKGKYGFGIYNTPDMISAKIVSLPMVKQDEIDRLINWWTSPQNCYKISI